MARKKGKGKGRAARNAKVNETGDDRDERFSKAPHSFVFHRGHVGKTVKELVSDTRKIMEPFTASRLKVRKRNVMKDFLTIAGPMHVSHFIVFTKTDIATYMKLICVPRGPTLTFKVCEYSLSRDVLSFQKHPDVESKLFNNHAVMVTNIPADSMENKLMNVTFKNMFPSINPNTVKLNNMRRTVLVNYDKDTKTVEIRHFTMKVVPTGISRAMKKLMRPKLPDMSNHEDIADVFLDRGMSDSEGEQDGPHSQVTVSQKIKDRGVARNATNAIRLKEIGPRLSLQLIKIEEGFEGGNILFHALVQKTPEEVEALKAIKLNKKKEKLARKQRQEANVNKKKEAKEEQIRKTVEGMERKKLETGNDDDNDDEEEEESDNDNDFVVDDNIEGESDDRSGVLGFGTHPKRARARDRKKVIMTSVENGGDDGKLIEGPYSLKTGKSERDEEDEGDEEDAEDEEEDEDSRYEEEKENKEQESSPRLSGQKISGPTQGWGSRNARRSKRRAEPSSNSASGSGVREGGEREGVREERKRAGVREGGWRTGVRGGQGAGDAERRQMRRIYQLLKSAHFNKQAGGGSKRANSSELEGIMGHYTGSEMDELAAKGDSRLRNEHVTGADRSDAAPPRGRKAKGRNGENKDIVSDRSRVVPPGVTGLGSNSGVANVGDVSNGHGLTSGQNRWNGKETRLADSPVAGLTDDVEGTAGHGSLPPRPGEDVYTPGWTNDLTRKHVSQATAAPLRGEINDKFSTRNSLFPSQLAARGTWVETLNKTWPLGRSRGDAKPTGGEGEKINSLMMNDDVRVVSLARAEDRAGEGGEGDDGRGCVLDYRDDKFSGEKLPDEVYGRGLGSPRRFEQRSKDTSDHSGKNAGLLLPLGNGLLGNERPSAKFDELPRPRLKPLRGQSAVTSIERKPNQRHNPRPLNQKKTQSRKPPGLAHHFS
ncbi:S-antigen protein, partial [Aplysia californica]|uniref:S-antigen protein n=1 Tax=Aplysia californica TaxID=6500 RepID=A0ABM1A5N2_APLCA